MNEEFRKALQHGPECPAIETLIGVMEHAEQGDRAALEAHLSACSSCQTELALYRGFETGEIRREERAAVDFIVKRLRSASGEPADTVRSWRRFWTPGWMGGAALAMAAVLLAVGLTSQRRVTESAVPASDDLTLRTNAVTITSPTGELNESPRTIRWRQVPGSVEYAVTLGEVDGTVIFHKKVTKWEIQLPEDTRKLLKPGKTVWVEVDALNRAGMELARSGHVNLQVRNSATYSH